MRIDIRDNGAGTGPEDRTVVFEKLRRAGDATNEPRGTGLGSHIGRQILGHLDGRLWVARRRGKGACFSFTLPTEAVRDEARVAG